MTNKHAGSIPLGSTLLFLTTFCSRQIIFSVDFMANVPLEKEKKKTVGNTTNRPAKKNKKNELLFGVLPYLVESYTRRRPWYQQKSEEETLRSASTGVRARVGDVISPPRKPWQTRKPGCAKGAKGVQILCLNTRQIAQALLFSRLLIQAFFLIRS